jgi:hypothetical protein
LEGGVKKRELVKRLGVAFAKMNNDELEVLVTVAERLMGPGRDQYGPLDIDSDGRDWKQEGFEEGIDWIVYATIRWLKEGRREGK